MIENTEILIDSNILVYAFNSSEPKKQQKALKLIDKCWKREVIFTVSLQNLAEFFITVTQKVPNPISIETANQIIFDIISFSNWKIIQYDTKALLYAASNSKGLHFWDALIASTMLRNNIHTIYTENTNDFSKFPNITAINPFKN